MKTKTFTAAILIFFFALISGSSPLNNQSISLKKAIEENPYPQISAIPVPKGFKRIASDKNSFAYWLRDVHLKKSNTVFLFDGRRKTNQKAQFAVLDFSVGTKDLQQCADAIMRLKAEYLFDREKFNEIVFFDNDGEKYPFQKPFSRDNFKLYLQKIFGVCGSASLSKQMHTVNILKNINPGDVFIRGGFPGHAVIVMDVAIDSTGVKAFLLAQSYMPAQDIHLLINPSNEVISPWYLVNDDPMIETPEFTFRRSELKCW